MLLLSIINEMSRQMASSNVAMTTPIYIYIGRQK